MLVSSGMEEGKVKGAIHELLSIKSKLETSASREASPNDKNIWFVSSVQADKGTWNLLQAREKTAEETMRKAKENEGAKKGKKPSTKKINAQLKELAEKVNIRVPSIKTAAEEEEESNRLKSEQGVSDADLAMLQEMNDIFSPDLTSTGQTTEARPIETDEYLEEEESREKISDVMFKIGLVDSQVKKMGILTEMKRSMKEFYEDDTLLKQTYLSEEAKEKIRSLKLNDYSDDNPVNYSGDEWKRRKTPEEIEQERERQRKVAIEVSIVYSILLSDREKDDCKSSFKNRFDVQKNARDFEGEGYEVPELSKQYIAEYLREPKGEERKCRRDELCHMVQMARRRKGIVQPSELAREFSSAAPIAELKTIHETPLEHHYGNHNNHFHQENSAHAHVDEEPMFLDYYQEDNPPAYSRDYHCPTSPVSNHFESEQFFSNTNRPKNNTNARQPAQPANQKASEINQSSSKRIGYGFVGTEFLLPAQREHFKLTGELPENRGLCVVCEIARVNEEFHLVSREYTVPKINDGTAFTCINPFRVKVGPGEYDDGACLQPYLLQGAWIIYGHFPMFKQTNYNYTVDNGVQKLVETGMGFRQSSVVSTRV